MLINLKLIKNYVINDEKTKLLTTTKTADNTQNTQCWNYFFLVILSSIALDKLESEKIGTVLG